MSLDYKNITKKYSNDYFCKNTERLIRLSIKLIKELQTGNFEYDTADTDRLLYDIRNKQNRYIERGV